MNPDVAAQKLKEWRWNKQHTAGSGICPGANGVVHRIAISDTRFTCLGDPRCDNNSLLAFFADAQSALETERDGSSPTPKQLPADAKTASVQASVEHPTSAQLVVRPNTLDEWKNHIWSVLTGLLKDEPEYFRTEKEIIVLKIGRNVDVIPYLRPPRDLSKTEVEEELDSLVGLFLEHEVNLPAIQEPGRELIVFENAAQALVSNQEYLSRAAVVDRLYYVRHISLGVGGKHEGKTTCVRTEALSVALGRDVHGRTSSQSHVIYAASDDEYPTTRMELLRMGWNPAVPLTLVRVKTEAAGEPERVLEQIARLANRSDSRFIVLDMLFDFAKVKDEMSYAGTRAAIALIQTLADDTNGHVRCTHHSPKHMPEATNAAKAALGSQGIAARFSPIVLSKKWAEGLFTIESTTTRDPRGEPLPVMCVKRDENGWLVNDGLFKSWMKWRVYADRILGLFDAGEPGHRETVNSIVEALEIARPDAQNALYRMSLGADAVLDREKGKGRGYKYFLKQRGLFSGSDGEGV